MPWWQEVKRLLPEEEELATDPQAEEEGSNTNLLGEAGGNMDRDKGMGTCQIGARREELHWDTVMAAISQDTPGQNAGQDQQMPSLTS